MGPEVFQGYQKLLLVYLRALFMHSWPAADDAVVATIQRSLAGRSGSDAARVPVEAVALLAHADPGWAAARLLALADHHPADVVDALESPYGRGELALVAPEALANLAMHYYLDDRATGLSMDDGLRDHSFEWSGVSAGPGRGPFAALLEAVPGRGVEVVRALLHRASEVRQRECPGYAPRPGRAVSGT